MLEDKAIQIHQIKFPFPIERIEADLFSRQLWIKLKDKNKNVILYSIDIDELSVNTIEMQIEIDNLVMSAVHNDFMVFSKITDPAQKSDFEFLIFDLKTKLLIKRISNRQFGGFVNATNVKAISMKFEEILEETVDLSGFRSSKHNYEKNISDIKHPVFVIRADDRFEILEQLLKEEFAATVVGAVEIFEHNQRIIMCVHLKKDEDLIKKILILDKDLKLVYNEDIYTSINRRIADSFFVYANFVIFVSEFNTMNFLRLSN